MGCAVTVVAMHSYGGEEREQHDNVEVIRLPCISALGGRCPTPKHDAAYRQAIEHLTGTAPDHVVVNARFHPLSRENLKFARKRGITPVLVEHGSAHLSMGSPRKRCGGSRQHAMTLLDKRQQPMCYAVSKKASA